METQLGMGGQERRPRLLMQICDERSQNFRDPINRFFGEVLIMAEDPVLRRTRLALVQQIAALPDGIADMSLLEGF